MKIQFESSTACNARCTICPRYDMTRPMGEMSDKLFYKIIKEGKELGANRFYPFLNGEPFVFSRIWQWLDYMKEEKVSFALYTNAEFMNVDRIIQYPNMRYINCSFNGATKETYDKLMRGPDFETAKKNIEDLIKKAPFRVQVSMVVTEENEHEIEVFKKMWGRKAKISQFVNYANARHSAIEKKGNKRVPCYEILNSINILWDGRVCLCCMDHDGRVTFGDLNKESLKDIVKRIEPLKERHRALDFDMLLCRDCNYNMV